MPLNQDTQNKIHAHIRKHAGACKLCGNTHWEVESDMVCMLAFDPEAKMINPNSVVPVVIAYCGNCKNMISFGASRIGLI